MHNKAYLLGFIVLIFWVKCALSNECLTVLDDEKCYRIQEAGKTLANRLKESDKVVQETIYRSIDEGGKMIESAIVFLKNEIKSVRVTHTGTGKITNLLTYN